ncbi:cobalamin-binding protein [bacterium]|nr:cobalamin-binding protein [bacterium]
MTHKRSMRTLKTAACAIILFVFASCCAASLVKGSGRSSITDASGKRVRVLLDAKRIVSLAPNITEILFALGLGERVVGVSSFSNYPPAANALPNVGGFSSPNLEAIVSLSPDIVIATMDGNPKREVEKLRALGIQVFCIFPNDISGLIKSIDLLGQVLSCGDAARELSDNIQSYIALLKRKAETLVKAGRSPKVLVALDYKPIISASGQTFLGQLVAIAGGTNIIGDSPLRYPKVSLEAIAAAAPDVILLTGHGSQKTLLKELRESKRWRSIPAVKNGRVHLLDPDLTTRPGPRTPGGLREIFSKLFPEEVE